MTKSDSHSWIHGNEPKIKEDFRQMIVIGILIFGILVVLLTGFYLRNII